MNSDSVVTRTRRVRYTKCTQPNPRKVALTESSNGTRRRNISFNEGRYKQVQTVFGSTVVDSGDASITGRQTTTSEIHPEFYKTQRKIRKAKRLGNLPPELYLQMTGKDMGGPFHTTKHDYWESHPNVNLRYSVPNWSYSFDGPLRPIATRVSAVDALWPLPSLYDDNDLRAAGATAIKLCSPLSPQVSIAASLGELRNDGLPLLPGKALFDAFRSRGRVISVLGSEALNILFGWKPTISELRNLSDVVSKSSEIIQQLRRDSGRPIRRHFEFPPVTSESTTILRAGSNMVTNPAPYGVFWTSTDGVSTKTIRKETRIWFDGCFSYLLDPGDSAVERAIYHARIAQAMYGALITPEVLWELTPWSWAIDWFTNIGDVITNLSNWAISGQTLRYGYVMREERITHTYTITGPTLRGGHNGPFVQSFTTIDKRRIKASPFGFQLEWNGFSNTQKAIVAALGISRSGL